MIFGFAESQIFALIIVWVIGTLIAGLIYSQIYQIRSNRGGFDGALNGWYGRSQVKADIVALQGDMSKFQDHLAHQLMGQQGGLIKQAKVEQAELLGAMAQVTSIEYPEMKWAAANMESLIDMGVVEEEWGANFNKLAGNPAALPHLNKACKYLYNKFGDNGNPLPKGGGGFSWGK